jgi:hypothetical protein
VEAGGSFTVWEEARVDDGEAALYSIYQGLFACSTLPLALPLAVTGAPPRAGCTFWHAERTSNEEYDAAPGGSRVWSSTSARRNIFGPRPRPWWPLL